jgi:hypothetical protein
MEEGVARPVEEFDEAKAFLRIEPLDDATDGWPGRGVEPGLAEQGSGAESTGLWMVGIGVEVTTPRMTKIMLSHFASWGVVPIGSVGRRLDLSPV